MTSYTPAQLRALEWLPADGTDKQMPDGFPLLLELEFLYLATDFVDDGEILDNSYRLTPAGIAERARLAKEGMIT